MTSWIWLPASPSQPGWQSPPASPLTPLPPPRLPDVLWGKPREGWVLRLGPLLLDPASGFLLITQISNRCVEAEHLIFIPQCVFFKWQMFFKAKKKKNSPSVIIFLKTWGGNKVCRRENKYPHHIASMWGLSSCEEL